MVTGEQSRLHPADLRPDQRLLQRQRRRRLLNSGACTLLLHHRIALLSMLSQQHCMLSQHERQLAGWQAQAGEGVGVKQPVEPKVVDGQDEARIVQFGEDQSLESRQGHPQGPAAAGIL